MSEKHTEGNPGKAYRDELKEKGSTFTDNNAEAAARDEAKMNKAATGQSQKMDGGNPYADEDGGDDEEIKKEAIEKKRG